MVRIMNFSLIFIGWTAIRVSAQHSSEDLCYPEIGCFSLERPWNGFWRFVPQSPVDVNTRFYLITRNTKNKSDEDWKIITTEKFEPCIETLRKADYQQARNMTVFYIYGFFSDEERKWERLRGMVRAHLYRKDVNVIVIDWDADSSKYDYRQCVSNTRIVAAVAVKFIQNLFKHFALIPQKVHIVGFSLGAHIAGYIGKAIPNIHRITALDAAQPGFEDGDERIRLHHNDAQFVDAFHTDAEPFFPKLGFGYMGAIGLVDFYFNDGKDQPGCWNVKADISAIMAIHSESHLFHRAKKLFNAEYASSTISHGIRCSHERAVEYWIEALQNTQCMMRGTKQKNAHLLRVLSKKLNDSSFYNSVISSLKNFVPIGLDTFTKPEHRGVFHVRTNSQRPYCIKLLESSEEISDKKSSEEFRALKHDKGGTRGYFDS